MSEVYAGVDDASLDTATAVYPGIEVLRELLFRPSWREKAACLGLDPELFHPRKGQSIAPAKAVCRGCPVVYDCGEHALARREKLGVWGGMSEAERRVLRRERREAAQAGEEVAS